ncbi:N-acetylmuramoyl-L-alanine amidase [Ginsengibacter hankyongi]|uniref:N-acetylmuramoyl-L-alanine amidase n=1 Tax=Ginsengibacter hankyongi TaxID=2607284 RepID=A0A5J5IJK5_9BACT|nr:N-acetylmuramoyl-L-alanine amidase [Ginsengibacter hankyongi]KAA9040688.1 N-acetylmuramoyl-L-alanine amidase [Ginsengibacter hankyongi]
MFELKKPFNFFLLLSSLLLLCSVTQAQTIKKIKTIIVDAGHGGSDDGARSEYEGSLNSKEKNVTLAIALKLVDELKKELPDVNIVPTRTTDIYQNPREKARIANENHGDLFVCIHADAVVLRTASRIIGHRKETYYTVRYVGKGKKRKKIRTPHTHVVPIREYYKLPTERKGTSTLIIASHKTSAKTEALEASEMQFNTDANDSTLDINYDSPEWKASALLYTQKFFKRSYQLATDVQDEIEATGRDNLGVWQRQKGIWVLQATQMPAVLIETGFIDNYQDERYLNSEKGQQEIAESITRALIKYKNQVESRPVVNADAMTTTQ